MTTATSTATAAADEVIAELERLPARNSVAMHVLGIIDDPSLSATDLGTAISADPGMTTRLLRVSNSAYYGLSGRVASVGFAVTVVGFDLIRAMAVTSLAGVHDDDGAMPVELLEDSARVAVATALVAPRVGARRPEAQSLGLLHNLGRWLLHRVDRPRYGQLLARASAGEDLARLEFATYGRPHGTLASAALDAWGFPDTFVEGVASQHLPAAAPRQPLAQALFGGLALARVATGRQPDGPAAREDHEAGLRMGFVDADAERLADQIRDETAVLLDALLG